MEQTGLLDREPVFHYDGDDRLERLLTGICNSSGFSPSEEAKWNQVCCCFSRS